MYKLKINPVARRDLLEIKDYITNELDSPNAAITTISNIINSYENLKAFPYLGIELSSRINLATDYRFLISGNYIIFYKVSENLVTIYRILNARRDYIKILFEKT